MPTFGVDDARVAIRGTLGSSNVQPNGAAMAIVPSLFVTVLQEIGRLCNSKVCCLLNVLVYI